MSRLRGRNDPVWVVLKVVVYLVLIELLWEFRHSSAFGFCYEGT